MAIEFIQSQKKGITKYPLNAINQDILCVFILHDIQISRKTIPKKG